MKIARYFVIFVIGILVGASVTNMVIGKQIDNLHISNQGLRQQLSVSERELQSLKESLEERKKQIITSIDVKVEFAGDELTSYEESSAILTAEKRVEEWLEVIKGQEINDVDYMLIPEIIDGREIEADGRKFNLKVKLVVITDAVIVYLEAKPVPKDSG
jgi:hypothetical protein